MLEVIFLIVLGGIWILAATIEDLRTREVANWLNFSLIIFALGFRFFYSLFSEDWNFLFQGLIGLGIFFVLGNVLYYGRMFAGGDAKLMISLGVILPFYPDLISNLEFFVMFLIIFLLMGAIYGIVWSVYLAIKNRNKFSKTFKTLFSKNKKFVSISLVLGVLLVILGFMLLKQGNLFLLTLGILFLLLPFLFLFAKSVDKSCMIAEISTKNLTEGDWLYKDVSFNDKKVKSRWEGLSLEEIKLLKKYKKTVLIRQGIPFVPVFLISYFWLLAFYFLEFDFVRLL